MNSSKRIALPLSEAVPDMRGWAVQAAIRLAVSLSGKSDDDIAAEMGWTMSIKSRIFHNMDYWPSLPNIPKFCEVVGNAVIAAWVIDNANFLVKKTGPTDAPRLMRQLRELLRSLSDLLAEAEKALEDETIDSREARRVIRELLPLFCVGGEMLAGLQAVINQEKGV